MPSSSDLFEAAYAAVDRAVAAHGSERQALIEEAIRLFHAAQAAQEAAKTDDAKRKPRAASRKRRSFGQPPPTH